MSVRSSFARTLETSLLCVIALTLFANCGKSNGEAEELNSGPFPALAFPQTGTVDAKTIPAGTYKAASVTSYLLSKHEGKKIESLFDHQFKAVGDPKKGDTVTRKTNWAGIPSTDKNAPQLMLRLNLPLGLTATGTSIAFDSKRYYTQRASLGGGWSWTVSGSDSSDGLAPYELFDSTPRAENKTIYGSEIVHATAKISDRRVTLVYETKVTTAGSIDSQQVVEVVYVRQ